MQLTGFLNPALEELVQRKIRLRAADADGFGLRIAVLEDS